MNTARQCLITLSQTYGYLSKQLYSFLLFFAFNTGILPEDVYWYSKFPNFQSEVLHFTLIALYLFLFSNSISCKQKNLKGLNNISKNCKVWNNQLYFLFQD